MGDTSGSLRSLMTTDLAKLWLISLVASTSVASSLPDLISGSEILKSGPTTFCHLDSLGMSCSLPLEESWIMRRPGGSTLEARFWDSSSEDNAAFLKLCCLDNL